MPGRLITDETVQKLYSSALSDADGEWRDTLVEGGIIDGPQQAGEAVLAYAFYIGSKLYNAKDGGFFALDGSAVADSLTENENLSDRERSVVTNVFRIITAIANNDSPMAAQLTWQAVGDPEDAVTALRAAAELFVQFQGDVSEHVRDEDDLDAWLDGLGD